MAPLRAQGVPHVVVAEGDVEVPLGEVFRRVQFAVHRQSLLELLQATVRPPGGAEDDPEGGEGGGQAGVTVWVFRGGIEAAVQFQHPLEAFRCLGVLTGLVELLPLVP